MLRSSGEFLRYSVNVALQKVQQLEETGHTDGPDGQNSDKTFRHLCEMTRSLPFKKKKQVQTIVIDKTFA